MSLPGEALNKVCPDCGTEVSSSLSEGLCPRCLLSTAMKGTVDDAAIDETLDSHSIAARTTHAGNGSPAPAMMFGDYELIEEVARGGMGVVYKARHQTLGRDVAMKVILSGQFASPNDVRRFQMEAESAATLDHPGIVPIYEIGEHQGNHFFTMKLIEGGSLAGQMQELRSDTRKFVQVLAEVAAAIDYAHRRGILHRDIKPANILLDHEGRPLVTDLGLAKRTGADSDLTGTGAIVGTPAYMPPEQASASKEVTTSADVYALGAILFEGLAGRPPHQGDSPVAILMKAAKGEIQRPSELERNVDRTLELICMKCLNSEPSERYASAGQLEKDLRAWLNGDAVTVRPKSFGSVLSDLMANQLRSAVGAMLIGIVGGLATAVPVYTGLANRWFGPTSEDFSLVELGQVSKTIAQQDQWWLHPPGWLGNEGFLLGVALSMLLGAIIQFVVRPAESRQALAVGLVAGLLMTIVQIGIYSIAANWQTFGQTNYAHLNRLARASVASDADRQDALKELQREFPALKNVEPDDRAELLGKLVSVKIMLVTPAVTIGILCVCLTFSSLFCVGGTLHANRLWQSQLSKLSKFFRYFEMMILLTVLAVMLAMIIFFCFGMVNSDGKVLSLPTSLLLAAAAFALATVPVWKHARWYVRWPCYVACVLFAMFCQPL